MADSISQTRYDYKIAFQKAIKEGKIVPVAFERCPLCCENRAFLLCDVCVNQGHFKHTQRESGRFHDKRQQLFETRKARQDLVKKFDANVQSTCRLDTKQTQIETTRRKIILLKKAIEETKKKSQKDRDALRQSKKTRRCLRDQLEGHQQETLAQLKLRVSSSYLHDLQGQPGLHHVLSVRFDKDFSARQLLTQAAASIPRPRKHSGHQTQGSGVDRKTVPVLKHELYLFNEYLAAQRRAFVRRLSHRIFPIREIFVPNNSSLEMSMATALQDASETAFIAGRWVHVDLKGENHSMIVQSTLPEYSGETSALGLFVMTNRYTTENPDKVPVGNQSHSIQSALSYTTMFVSLAASVCDVHLPRKCSFRELRDDMTQDDFCNFVWRLHQNIQHWAASQGTDTDFLVDNLSLCNLLAILDTNTLGRVSPFEPTYTMTVVAEPCLVEYAESEEDEAETGGGSGVPDVDWERVPSGIPSYEVVNMGVSAPAGDSTSTTGALFNAAASMTGNAAASLTGWFKSYYNK